MVVSRTFWKRFAADFMHFLGVPGFPLPPYQDAAYLLACFFQALRAFYQDCHPSPALRHRRRYCAARLAV